ncbi:MAG: hypothetical protein ACOC44_20620 [Promethearchaeia archaeon]
MSLQELIIVANEIYNEKEATNSLTSYLDKKYESNEEYSILDYLKYLSKSKNRKDIEQLSSKYVDNIESSLDDIEKLKKIINWIDRFFSMYSMGWVIYNHGEDFYIGNTKIQKIAFFTNFKECLSDQRLLGFGEPFLSYHHGPWSLSLHQDIELLQATGFLQIRNENEGLKPSEKCEVLASSFEESIKQIPQGESFLKTLSENSEKIGGFNTTDAMLEFFYDKFPIFEDIRDECLTVSSRRNGEIKISDSVKESYKEEL